MFQNMSPITSIVVYPHYIFPFACPDIKLPSRHPSLLLADAGPYVSAFLFHRAATQFLWIRIHINKSLHTDALRPVTRPNLAC